MSIFVFFFLKTAVKYKQPNNYINLKLSITHKQMFSHLQQHRFKQLKFKRLFIVKFGIFHWSRALFLIVEVIIE